MKKFTSLVLAVCVLAALLAPLSTILVSAAEPYWMWPLPYTTNVTSPYGWRESYGKMHYGIDIAAAGCNGAPIIASKSGTVIEVQKDNGSGWGDYVKINHGDNKYTLYAHMSAFNT
ncbi:MAG: M23 family metallopeptidase, partial [Clostridia bacterium]|nr:M23 family metallopeptidase [Clostridia bacterium]